MDRNNSNQRQDPFPESSWGQQLTAPQNNQAGTSIPAPLSIITDSGPPISWYMNADRSKEPWIGPGQHRQPQDWNELYTHYQQQQHPQQQLHQNQQPHQRPQLQQYIQLHQGSQNSQYFNHSGSAFNQYRSMASCSDSGTQPFDSGFSGNVDSAYGSNNLRANPAPSVTSASLFNAEESFGVSPQGLEPQGLENFHQMWSVNEPPMPPPSMPPPSPPSPPPPPPSRSSRPSRPAPLPSRQSSHNETSSRNPRRFSCEKCKNTFNSKLEVKKHQRSHEKSHACDVDSCTSKFGTKNDLKRHRATIHKDTSQLKAVYICSKCPPTKGCITRLDNFRTHVFKIHHFRPDQKFLESCAKNPDSINAESVADGSKALPNDNLEEAEGDVDMGVDASPTNPPDNPNSDVPPYLENDLPLPPDDSLIPPLPSESSLEVHVPSAHQFDVDADLTIDNASSTTQPPLTEANTADIQRRLQKAPEDKDRRQEYLRRNFSFQELQAAAEAAATAAPVGAATVGGGEATSTIRRSACNICTKSFKRLSELKKHKKRHDKPYGCTNYGCNKSFGSKGDWKRHELHQHNSQENWRCNFTGCERIYTRQGELEIHLVGQHGVRNDSVGFADKIDSCRRGLYSDDDFWCGFCNRQCQVSAGSKAWDKRFDHIGDHLFGKGDLIKKSMEDWCHLEDRPNQETEATGKEEATASDNDISIYDTVDQYTGNAGSSMTAATAIDNDISSYGANSNASNAGTSMTAKTAPGTSFENRKIKLPHPNPSSSRKIDATSSQYHWMCCLCTNSIEMSVKLTMSCFDCSHARCRSCNVMSSMPPIESDRNT